MRYATLTIVLLICALPTQVQVTVTRVVDGDTFYLSDDRMVRLIGIDTPEKYNTAKLRRDARCTGATSK